MSLSLEKVAAHKDARRARMIAIVYPTQCSTDRYGSSSCWVIINGKVYDVTEFLPWVSSTPTSL